VKICVSGPLGGDLAILLSKTESATLIVTNKVKKTST